VTQANGERIAVGDPRARGIFRSVAGEYSPNERQQLWSGFLRVSWPWQRSSGSSRQLSDCSFKYLASVSGVTSAGDGRISH